ncbi:F-box protein At3g44326-like [Cryptomeria japonica]|uniref:F-box protein At3g44326-like n=1 Tax=Cryptomeria japonica TaxID=3369 RepID=UPI0027DA4384|nr:F-box protein At3g44326-like [Cryptomeria japonica]
MSSLSNDIVVAEILRRVDGISLAKVGCSSCDFRSIAREEWLWENMCNSLWPSTQKEEVKQLISSLGGFRKFYGDCFPLLKEPDVLVSVSPSDLLSLVDIQYDNKSVYSKVIAANDMIDYDHWRSSIYPFQVNLLCDSDDIFPSIAADFIQSDENSESKTLVMNMRLSWICISTKTKHAVNLSSWRPLQAQKNDWGYDNHFTVRFGSILPAPYTLPLELAECNIVVRCRFTGGYLENTNLQISEVSIQLENMMGNRMDPLLSLHRAVEWRRRSIDHDKVMQVLHELLQIQNDYLVEEKVSTGLMNPLYIMISVVAVALPYYFISAYL